MKKVLFLIVLIVAGYLIFSLNNGGLKVNLAQASSGTVNNQANTVGVLQGGNPALSRAVVDGVDSFVLTAKIVVENKEKNSISFSLSEPNGTLGELVSITRSTSGSWTSRLRDIYTPVSPVPVKKITLVNDMTGAAVNGLSITAKANSKETYSIKIVVKANDLPNGKYAMRLHSDKGGYYLEQNSTNRNIKSISTNYSNSLDLSRTTPPATTPDATQQLKIESAKAHRDADGFPATYELEIKGKDLSGKMITLVSPSGKTTSRQHIAGDSCILSIGNASSQASLNTINSVGICIYLQNFLLTESGTYQVFVKSGNVESNRLPVQINHKTADSVHFPPKMTVPLDDYVFTAGAKKEIRIAGYRGEVGVNTIKLILKTENGGVAIATIATLRPNENVFTWNVPSTLAAGKYDIYIQIDGDSSNISFKRGADYPLRITVKNSQPVPSADSQIKVEHVSSLMTEPAFPESTPGIEAVFKAKITPTVDINVSNLSPNVDYYEAGSSRFFSTTRARVVVLDGSSIIPKGVTKDVEFRAANSGSLNSLLKGKSYSAKLSALIVDQSSIGGSRIIKDTGLERFVTNTLTYKYDPTLKMVIELPTKSTVWKKNQTNQIKISGYTAKIRDGEKFAIIKKGLAFLKDSEIGLNHLYTGSFIKGQSTYNISIPRTLQTGEYYIRFNDVVTDSFQITE